MGRYQLSVRSRRRLPIGVIALVTAVAAGALGVTVWFVSTPRADTSAALADVDGPQTGRPAPAFAVPGLSGGRVTLGQYAGHPRVISFFASWCESCWNDVRTLQRGYERYRDQGVVVLGIGARDTAGSLRSMTERLHVTFPTGYDERGDLAAQPFHLYTIPTTVFVGANGVIKGVVQGRVHSDTLRKYITLILPAAATPQ